ncbi:hypothetical protein [Micromonospora sp. NPDC005806]|uniref:hypothetical protein n=1 Tax=Micromonospora sp. NPDC005806 TaxID=3364234 RepID=UPI003689C6B8
MPFPAVRTRRTALTAQLDHDVRLFKDTSATDWRSFTVRRWLADRGRSMASGSVRRSRTLRAENLYFALATNRTIGADSYPRQLT